ncbi:gfo/Idh/MocA family oxidoreductase [Cohnella fermenti]|uniref:Gfo/Idh/MocA family oxidoreductase n=2 Tax=Cohnella fermenti TaxID=2565925 RepID=A0A4V3WEB1_9BACL|nr:gfo/Idh/MocA family oxidoreductase [Cohnella fermenti]
MLPGGVSRAGQAALRLAIVGTDTSHSAAFAQLLFDRTHPYHVPGARVAAAYPGGSPDIELSRSRVDGFAARLRDEFGVRLAATPEEAADGADAVLLLSADGRQHLELFRRVAKPGRPVFVDKPLATTYRDARELAKLAAALGVPLLSGSALRYAEDMVAGLERVGGREAMIGADCYGPIAMDAALGGYLWYGIHAAEMLYAAMGTGCERVTAVAAGGSSGDGQLVVGNGRMAGGNGGNGGSGRLAGEHLVGVWKDGRVGTMRGSYSGAEFGAVLHREAASCYMRVKPESRPFYASLLERVIPFLRGDEVPGLPTVDETLEIIRFLEAANLSRERGRTVRLDEIE